jgi:SpoIIAA-like
VEFAIEFGGDPQDLTITMSGRADVDAFRRVTEELLADPRYRAGMAILVDHSALDPTPLSNGDVPEAADPILERDWNFPPKAVAIVVPPTPHARELAERGVAHMSVLKRPRRVFRSRDEALTWLREQRLSR